MSVSRLSNEILRKQIPRMKNISHSEYHVQRTNDITIHRYNRTNNRQQYKFSENGMWFWGYLRTDNRKKVKIIKINSRRHNEE